MKLIRCPKCDTYTRPEEDERWCQEHGAIPLPEPNYPQNRRRKQDEPV